MSAGGSPGKNGVSRGRGDAELNFSDETPGRTDQFEAKQLPDASYLDPQSTAIVGIGGARPEAQPQAEGGGSVETQTSAGKSAWKRRLAPHHREAVQEFFGGKKEDR